MTTMQSQLVMEKTTTFVQAEKQIMAGQFESALSLLLSLQGTYPESGNLHKCLGTCYFALQNFANACKSFTIAAQQFPEDPNILANFGTVLFQDRQIDKASGVLQKALNLAPDDVQVRLKLAAILLNKDQKNQAIQLIEQGIERLPDNKQLQDILSSLSGGVTLQSGPQAKQVVSKDAQLENFWKQRQLEPLLNELLARIQSPEAAKHVNVVQDYARQTMQLLPNSCYPHLALALAYQVQQDTVNKLKHYRKGLQLNNNDINILQTAAMSFVADFSLQEADYCFERALKLGATFNRRVMTSYALLAMEQGRYDEAEQRYLEAQNSSSDSSSSGSSSRSMGLALLKLMHKDFEQGWRLYDHRKIKISQLNTALDKGIPLWQGESLHDKTLGIVFEQGHGDTLQFWRFIPDICRQAKKVVFYSNHLIVSLLQANDFGIANLEISANPIDSADYVMPLMDLGKMLQLDTQAIKASAHSYITAPQTHIEKWRTKFESVVELKVGIAWAGNPDNGRDKIRSAPPLLLAPLLGERHCRFYSLQFEHPLPDVFQPVVTDLQEHIKDFNDTAAIIHHLDLVITVDTGVAHLAASMGKPVWLMITHVPDWRWGLKSTQSDWYPSVTLFRHEESGETNEQVWQQCIEQVKSKLTRWRKEQRKLQDASFSTVSDAKTYGDSSGGSKWRDNSSTEHAIAQINLLLSCQHPELAMQLLEELATESLNKAQLQRLDYQRVQILVALHRDEEAWAIAEALCKEQFPTANQLYYRGLLAMKLHNYKQAFNLFCRVPALQDLEESHYIHLMQAALYNGEHHYAQHLLEALLRGQPNNKAFLKHAFEQRLSLQQLDNAKNALKHWMLHHPEPDAMCAMAKLQKLEGKWHDAWFNYEKRKCLPAISKLTEQLPLPEWQGLRNPDPRRSTSQLTLLVYCEKVTGENISGDQSISQQIMYLRYLPKLIAMFNKVYLRIDPALHALVAAQQLDVTLIEQQTPADADVCASLCSLPFLFDSQWQYEHFDQPYLKATQALPSAFDKWTKQHVQKLKVGLVWAGDPNHPDAMLRSIPVSEFNGIFEVEGVSFCSLQTGDGAAQLKTKFPILDCSAMMTDNLTAANIINELDLVISVDSSIAHLAGALGKPCWLLLPFVPDGHWQLQGEKTLWYRSLRLFRQNQLADWLDVINRVATELKQLKLVSKQN